MLSFRNRFHGHSSINYVFRNGSAIRNRWFTIKYTENRRRKDTRVAVVVSKKVLKSAVGRNRVRRRVYEVFRTTILPDLQGVVYDIAIIVTSADIKEIANTELTSEFVDKFTEAGIYKTKHS